MSNVTTAMRSYKITKSDFALLHGAFPSLLLRDDVSAGDSWERFDEESLKEYFGKGYGIFLARLEEFRSLTRPLSREEEKELKFMLEALVTAKNTLESRAE